MAKIEWGIKRFCQKCHSKYYDMQKTPITCPKCGTIFQQEFLKSRDEIRGELDLEHIDLEKDIHDLDVESFEEDDYEESPVLNDDDQEKH